jgi:2'-hydroxyisoflavone reductase
LQLTRRAAAAALPLAATPAFAQPRKPLKILILGGTGFTGPHQIRYALARGHQVTVFNRGRRRNEFTGRVEELTGDRNTGDLKALAGRTWDVCIDNPTTFPMWVRDAGQALKGAVGHYVFISTISVYARNDRPGDDETAAVHKYAGADAYAEKTIGPLYGPLKAFSEQEAARQFGPDKVTVIRPGLIVGPGDESDRFTYWPQRIARGGEVLAPGGGGDPVQFIDARDIAEWTIRMVEQRRVGVFNATGPARPMTMRQMLEGVARGVNARPQLVWIPAAWLAEQKVRPWVDLPVWVPGEGETAGFSRVSIARALGAGLTFRPLAATAADTLAWWRTQPAERQAKMRAGLAPEREAQLLAEWKKFKA